MTSKSDLMKSCGITAVVHEVGSYDSAHNVTTVTKFKPIVDHQVFPDGTSVWVHYPTDKLPAKP